MRCRRREWFDTSDAMAQHHTRIPFDFQVEWRAPRPFSEFLTPSAFILPKSGQKWNSRMKNNLWVLYKWLYENLSFLFHASCPCGDLWVLFQISHFPCTTHDTWILTPHDTWICTHLNYPSSPKLGTITDQTTLHSSCWALFFSSCVTQSPYWL